MAARLTRVGWIGAAAIAVSGMVLGAVPSPEEVLHLAVGKDRVLASYEESVRYLRALEQSSPRVRLVPVGPTVEGRSIVAAVISSPANLARLGELRKAWAAIADPRAQAAVAPPPEFRRGIAKEGVEALRAFAAGGGTLIGFSASAEWIAETLELPVTNSLKEVGREEFFAPGALLELEVDRTTPIGLGIRASVAVMVDAPVGFQTRPSIPGAQRVVAARFPNRALVLSGWLRGEERLRRRAAVVSCRFERGTVVLYSFAPYFRGQTEAAFGLLYNAVFTAMVESKPVR